MSSGDSNALEQLANRVEHWRRQGIDAVLARVAVYRGFGGARRGELLAVNAKGEQAGALLRGSLDAAVLAAAESLLARGLGAAIIEVRVPSEEAVPAGLSCGGQRGGTISPRTSKSTVISSAPLRRAIRG